MTQFLVSIRQTQLTLSISVTSDKPNGMSLEESNWLPSIMNILLIIIYLLNMTDYMCLKLTSFEFRESGVIPPNLYSF